MCGARSSAAPARRRGSVPAVLLMITTTGKVTLLIVAGAFIAWALITAIWIPKRNPGFPGHADRVRAGLVSVLRRPDGCRLLGDEHAGGRDGGGRRSGDACRDDACRDDTTPSTTPETGGEADVGAGKDVFASAGCSGCHTLADAGASGTVGPSLDERKPPSDLVVTRVTNGKGAMPSVRGAADRAADPGRRGLRLVCRRLVLAPFRGRQPCDAAACGYAFMATERCPSGRRSATGNRVSAERCFAGSNPALSAGKGPQAGLFLVPDHDPTRRMG